MGVLRKTLIYDRLLTVYTKETYVKNKATKRSILVERSSR